MFFISFSIFLFVIVSFFLFGRSSLCFWYFKVIAVIFSAILIAHVASFSYDHGFGKIILLSTDGFEASFSYDFFSLIILFILSLVGFSIVYYSYGYYMSSEPKLNLFCVYLIFFIFFIFLLVSASSFFWILVGWESVGIMSFLLISWWFGRSDATSASIQAIIYNRIGDFSLYVVILSFFVFSEGSMFFFDLSCFPFWISVCLILAIISKSSQFLFHPWLPNAMEGPTPVSSLLHSSTIVVAGVYLFIRSVHFFDYTSCSIVVLFSAVTMLYSGVCGTGQTDIKNVIAFSTTSQLGFMIVSVGLLGVYVGFFLLVMHAFFNSVLFMTSSVYIHTAGSTQENVTLSWTWNGGSLFNNVFVLASMSLAGLPFFAGFYSKDIILENMWGALLNRFVVLVVIVSCVFTVAYSLRLFVVMSLSCSFLPNFTNLYSQDKFGINLSWPLLLVGGAVFLGLIFSSLIYLPFGEEYVSFLCKVIPFIILFGGTFIGIYVLYKWDTGHFFHMLYYNPLLHRVVTYLIIDLNYKFLIMEFYWMENFLKGFYYNLRTTSIYSVGIMTLKGFFFSLCLSMSILIYVFFSY